MDELRQPTLNRAIGAAGEVEGWAWFDQQPQGGAEQLERERAKAREEIDRTAEAAAALYAGSHEFRVVLEWMLDGTLRRAAWQPQLGLPTDQIYGYGCFREGQNAMVHTLLKMIAEGLKTKPPKPRDS